MFANKFSNNVDIAQEVDNTCTEECIQRDCTTHLFVPRYLTTERIPPSVSTGSTITIAQFISLIPVLKSDCLEQISLIQFLTDIASSLGFWLGMTAIN